MALVEWRDEFSVGVPAVDFEHRELIDLINDLHQRLMTDHDPAAVSVFLGEIYTRISAHFALEEKIMRDAGYDEYAVHKADHERLLDGILDMADDYDQHDGFDEADFAERLRRWFVDHFQTKDARLHSQLG
jgi:hemerythrin